MKHKAPFTTKQAVCIYLHLEIKKNRYMIYIPCRQNSLDATALRGLKYSSPLWGGNNHHILEQTFRSSHPDNRADHLSRGTPLHQTVSHTEHRRNVPYAMFSPRL